MSNRLTYIIAIGLLVFVFIIATFSMKDDSLTSDELVHLPAGYSYLTQKDMRLNPEHPPLIKDLASLPLLFIKEIKFPTETDAWQKNVNDQWEFGSYFLYRMGNPVDKMIFWGRIPMILVLILLGFYIFKFAREFFGNKVALLSLFLFSFSPTFLAHGRLVTTDVGAATGVVIATYYFLKFLEKNTWKNLIGAGIALGLALLTKFSTILLFPFFILLLLFWTIKNSSNFKDFFKILSRYFLRFILILLISFLIIGVFYQYHVWNYPPEKQAKDTQSILSSPNYHSIVWMADKPILRPFAQYLLGLIMATQRTSGGETIYFFGEISSTGWKTYFPFVYLIKEPLTFHVLTLIALLFVIFSIIKQPFWLNAWQKTREWLNFHFPEFAFISFIIIYWIVSLSSNLNIGVRHLLPLFPFTFILISSVIINLTKTPFLKIKLAILGGLIFWQIISVISIYPYFLAYFNELIGGDEKGYLYLADSNLDWGQDLKRLSQWVNKRGIDKIYVDYSGGYDKTYYSTEKHYLKEKFLPWWNERDPKELPKNSYLAVSVFFLQRERGVPVAGFSGSRGHYRWLDKYQPIAKIGYSIFVYYIE